MLKQTQHGLFHAPEIASATTMVDGVKCTLRNLNMNAFLDPASTGHERFLAARNLIFMTWPSFIEGVEILGPLRPRWRPSPQWNSWLERMLKGFLSDEYAVKQGDSVFRFIGLTGVGAASKTFTTGLFASLWWLTSPHNSIVILTSTTKDMIRNRVWSNITKCWQSAQDLETGTPLGVGHMLDSQMKLLSARGDAKHSISAYAVAHGETLKAIDNLKGLHAERMLVVIDECNGTPEAILQVISNYRKACRDFTLIVIGNPSQRLDPHGRLCKPADGWSLAMNDTNIEWKTEGVPEWQVDPGLCLRFDGRDSPNVRLARNAYPYIYTLDNWHSAQSAFATHGGTFAYWTQDRGMWPPEGFSNTVFTETLFVRCDAIGTHFTFVTERESCAFADVAFGGDACILQLGEIGIIEGGRRALQLTEWIEVPIDATSQQHDRDYIVARFIMQECKNRHIKPRNFGLDATGTGRGVAAIIAAEWSDQIHCVYWGQGATDRPSAEFDNRPARELFTTFVGECHWALRDGMEAGLIKGFSKEAINQLCARLFEMSGKKHRLETKQEMRLRLRYSPDHADAVVGIFEMARRNGLILAGKLTLQSAENFEIVKQHQQSLVEDSAHESSGWAETSEEAAYEESYWHGF